MDAKGANPFLFEEEDYPSSNAAPLNPFLMDEDDFPNNAVNDNPFLSQTAVTVAPANTNSTNPFAFDPMELGPYEAQPASDITTNFHANNDQTVIDPNVNYQANTDFTSYKSPELIANLISNVPPQKPTDLDLKHTITVSKDVDHQGINGGPPRPPPPRPPPSKETQDLLMSVMGAMDANSSHLLDRIPATRTPSPVSMRDLHSPSPTPEPMFADLLDVSDNKPQEENKPDQHSDLLSLSDDNPCDINQNPPTLAPSLPINQPIEEPVVMQPPPPRPQPPPPPVARPPRPTPPQKPLPPPAVVPPKPPPPLTQLDPINIPDPTSKVQTNLEEDMFDMFGVGEFKQPQKVVASTADIMNLYSASQVFSKPQLKDLLFDTLETEVKPSVGVFNAAAEPAPQAAPAVPPAPVVTTKLDTTFIDEPVAEQESITSTPVIQDSVASPEPSQSDFQMDTSDSQSKDSASSVTFNPFAGNEEAASPIKPAGEVRPNTVPPTDAFGSNVSNINQNSPADAFGTNVSSFNHSPPDDAFGTNVSSFKQNLPADAFGANVSSFNQNPPADAFGTNVSSFNQNPPADAFGTNVSSFNQNPPADAFGANVSSFNQSSPADAFGTNVSSFKQNPPADAFGTNVSSFNQNPPADAFGTNVSSFNQNPPADAFGSNVTNINQNQNSFGFGEPKKNDEFDAFAMKFESAAKDENKNGIFDAFSGGATDDAWGQGANDFNDSTTGFGNDEPFDAFLSMNIPSVPQSTPNRMSKNPSQDSDEDKDFSVVIRPKNDMAFADQVMPILAPPPSAPVQSSFSDTSPRFNPFDQSQVESKVAVPDSLPIGEPLPRSDSQETPPTPLFDEDVSQPLEPFPRINFKEEGWELQLRQPNKKKITGQRFWKKIFIRLLAQTDCVLLQLFNQRGDKDPFQELPLQPCYSVSDISAQQYDNYGKIFTLKLQYIFYKERPGVRPGQVKKAERITNKLSQFASYAIQGDYQGVKEFGSDLKKLGLPVEHAPQISQLMKLGSLNYEDLKQFSVSLEEALFTLQAHRDRALHYKMEEVQITSVDELYVEQDSEGHIERQIARVRLFFLGFLTGMPDIELGINDMRRQGKEVVGRHDIIPVVTEEWIRLENVEFHSSIQQDDYNDSHIIKFKPPDACYIELLRFRVRPPKNRELPLQLKCSINVTGNKVVIKADVLVPGFASRKLGQVPCEDVMIRIPIPECWIYLFRVEKHFRYGSVKSTHRRTGKIKGIERILGTMETLQESLIEVTSGQAKYEHQHRAIVWRCPRLPKEGQGAYTTHNLICKMALTSYDQVPDQLAEYCYVEFTMPATQVSHTTVRSVSLQNSDSDDPPEKYVRYLARHEYRVGIEHTEGDSIAAYSAVTYAKPAPPPVQEQQPPTIPENESSDDSDD